jgi:hypothetical protein
MAETVLWTKRPVPVLHTCPEMQVRGQEFGGRERVTLEKNSTDCITILRPPRKLASSFRCI